MKLGHRKKVTLAISISIAAAVITATIVKLLGEPITFFSLVGVGFVIGFFFGLPSLLWVFWPRW